MLYCSIFVNLSDIKIEKVPLANNETTEITGLGKAFIKVEVNTKFQNIKVHDSLLAPKLKTSLLLFARICDQRYIYTQVHSKCTVINFKDNVMLIADCYDDPYYLQGSGNTNYCVDFSSESIDSTKQLVHRCSKLHII